MYGCFKSLADMAVFRGALLYDCNIDNDGVVVVEVEVIVT